MVPGGILHTMKVLVGGTYQVCLHAYVVDIPRRAMGVDGLHFHSDSIDVQALLGDCSDSRGCPLFSWVVDAVNSYMASAFPAWRRCRVCVMLWREERHSAANDAKFQMGIGVLVLRSPFYVSALCAAH